MFSQTHTSLINVIHELRLICDTPIAIGGVHVTGSMSDEKTKTQVFRGYEGCKLYIFE